MARYPDELCCDFAEVYHVYEISELSPVVASRFFFGLSDDSRTKRAIAGRDCSTDQLLLAMIYDSINWLCWTKTVDGVKGKNKPSSLVDKLLHKEEHNENKKPVSFATKEAFMETRNKILRGG